MGMVNAVVWDEDGADYMDPEYFLGFGTRYQGIGFDYSAMKPKSELGLGHKITVIASF